MLNKFKQKLSDMSKNGVTIPVKPIMLEQLIKRQTEQKDIKVEITSTNIVIKGTVGDVSYKIKLKPAQMEKRMIVFEIESIQPIDVNRDDMIIFRNPPFSGYTKETVNMDFNSWDIVKKVPVGKIKTYEMNDGVINLTISL